MQNLLEQCGCVVAFMLAFVAFALSDTISRSYFDILMSFLLLTCMEDILLSADI